MHHRTILPRLADKCHKSLPRLILVATLALIIPCLPARSQTPFSYTARTYVAPDSADVTKARKKHFWRAVAETAGANLGVWLYDRYVLYADWSFISANTVKENFKHGFLWDNDKNVDNCFSHPYHGSIFFNAGRSNGYNFWQSGLFALGGSAMWELFMEREYPSFNDIIITPAGGMTIGEPLYRLSDMVLDNRATRGARVGREIAGFLLDPMRGLNRLFTGEMWHHSPTSGQHFGLPNIFIRTSLGVKTLAYDDNYTNVYRGVVAQVDVEYGDRFEDSSAKPYDFFTLSTTLQHMKSQPFLNNLEIIGRILCRKVLDKNHSQASIGLYQNFDYFDTDTIDNLYRENKPDINPVPYKLGTPASVGAGFMFREKRDRCVFDTYAHINAVLLGTILTDHYWTDFRNYNWTSGFALKGGVNLSLGKDIFTLALNQKYYRLYTWKGYPKGLNLSTVNFRTLNVMGDKSTAHFSVTEARADVRIWRKLYLTAIVEYYLRKTHYRDWPDYRSESTEFKLMASYLF